MKIALLSLIDGQSIDQWQSFVFQTQRSFMPFAERQYFLFSSDEAPTRLPPGVEWCQQNDQTLDFDKRHCLLPTLPIDLLCQFDWVFYLSLNLTFFRAIGRDLLPKRDHELVVVQHAEYVNLPPDRLPFERNQKSTAYVSIGQGIYYVTHQIVGGRPRIFQAMAESMHQSLIEDCRNGVVAERLPEAHLNRYLIDHPHCLKHSGYCYPQGWDLGVPRMILCKSGNTSHQSDKRGSGHTGELDRNSSRERVSRAA